MRCAWQVCLAAMTLAIGTGVVLAPASRAAATGCGVGKPCLRVHLPGGGIEVVSGSQIAAQASGHSTCVQYPERVAAGATVVDGPCVLTFLSVHTLLDNLLFTLSPPIAPSSIETTKLIRPFDGTGSFLTGTDLDDPSDFADPSLLPAFYLSGNGGSLLQYVRPLRSGTADVNATDDVIQTPNDGSPLDLYLYTGPLLRATATRSKGTIKVGQSVTFTARAAGATAYHWDFGDGSTGEGLTVTHTFQAPGTPQILLTVSGPDDATGEAAPLTVTVTGTGTPPPSASPSPGAGGSPRSSPPTPPAGSANGSGPRGGGAVNGGGGDAGSATQQPAPATTAAGAGPPGPHRSSATLPVDASLPVVRGRVIGADGTVYVLPAASPAAAAAKPGRPAGSASSGERALVGGGGGVTIMLLLGAGAVSERRWVRSRKSMVDRR